MEKEHVIRGISFPLRVGMRGQMVMSKADDYENIHLDESIIQIVLTRLGERPVEPGFGTSMVELLFENNPSLEAIVVRNIMGALNRWEPRIELEEEDIDIIRDDDGLAIKIEYEFLPFRRRAYTIVRLPEDF